MNIYTNLDDLKPIKNPVLTIGTYDGVHLGHKQIINFINDKAKEVNGESVVFTFHPHPRMVLHPDDHNLELIQTIDERIEKLEKAGVDHLIVFPFSKAFSRLSATEFVRDILVNQIGVHTLVIGYDHQFGRNREGSMAQLEELAPLYDFKLEEISAFMKGEVKISSTKIRKALSEGDVYEANKYLGDFFALQGKVVEGDKIGSKIDFPTANIQVTEKTKLIPCNGVYAVKVLVEDEIFDGMLNIGVRPTVNISSEKRIEVHIFDCDKNLYNESIEVKFIERVRDEIHFDGLESLQNQLKEDEKKCRYILAASSFISL